MCYVWSVGRKNATVKALAFILGALLALIAAALWSSCICAMNGGKLAPAGTKVTRCIETPEIGSLCREVEIEGCMYP